MERGIFPLWAPGALRALRSQVPMRRASVRRRWHELARRLPCALQKMQVIENGRVTRLQVVCTEFLYGKLAQRVSYWFRLVFAL
jgi:hypothetical protein